MAIIASILGILFFILLEVLPLTRPARIAIGATVDVDQEIQALTVDEYQTHAALARAGRRDPGRPPRRRQGGRREAARRGSRGPDGPPSRRGSPRRHRRRRLRPATAGCSRRPIDWRVEFASDGTRSVHPEFPEPVALEVDLERRPLGTFAAQLDGPERAAAAAQLADGSVAVVKREAIENAFSGEITRSEERLTFPAVPPLTQMLIDRDQANLFGGTAGGDLYWWRLDQGADFPRAGRLRPGRSRSPRSPSSSATARWSSARRTATSASGSRCGRRARRASSSPASTTSRRTPRRSR